VRVALQASGGRVEQAGLVQPLVAYFSMEIALEQGLPTYAGGLGVLAGDNLRAAADLGLPLIGVTLLYRRGYFRQSLDGAGRQSEAPEEWSPEARLERLEPRVEVRIEGRSVKLAAWRYRVRGLSGREVPVYLLDAALPENDPRDRALSDLLYGGDQRYRLGQEIVLGLGGLKMLEALGHQVEVFHLNEGHSALLTLGLLCEALAQHGPADPEAAREAVRRRCVFTTHTPVPAGQDAFPLPLFEEVVGRDAPACLEAREHALDGMVNLTYLALTMSHYVNGVSQRHDEVASGMYPSYAISSVTNGVHAATWVTPPFVALFDRHVPQWRRDNMYLRYVVNVASNEVMDAHRAAKADLIGEVEKRTDLRLQRDVFTIGFARRATAYKRADLLFSDLERLRAIVRRVGPLQVLYAGKAHPRDEAGKELIQRVFAAAEALRDAMRVLYLPDYDLELARLMCGGVDVWLNTPQKPLEASGTSGMKAALNGVPSLSVLDGWWIEGHVEGVTGWSIGESWSEDSNPAMEVESLYDKLEYVILPQFYSRPAEYARVMRSTIALNGSFFNAQRMLLQYEQNAYRTVATTGPGR
jgi:starch phosphorylase